MMCQMCKDAADYNRIVFDNSGSDSSFYWAHPDNCECTCEHRNPEQWEKQFSVKQP